MKCDMHAENAAPRKVKAQNDSTHQSTIPSFSQSIFLESLSITQSPCEQFSFQLPSGNWTRG
jgi:hypothetical protein